MHGSFETDHSIQRVQQSRWSSAAADRRMFVYGRCRDDAVILCQYIVVRATDLKIPPASDLHSTGLMSWRLHESHSLFSK